MSTKTRVHRFEDVIGYLQQEHRTLLHLLHFAVQRYRVYMHHFIVLGHTWSDDLECCQIIHFSSVAQSSSGEVRQDTYYKTDFENDIESGLYLFRNENYPTTDEQYQQAYLRLRRRLENNENYSISVNNCEHLVYHILTGHPFSSQVNEGSVVTRYFMDLFDVDAIKGMIENTVIASSSRIGSSSVYCMYTREKIIQLLEKASKRGIMNRVKDMLVMSYRKIIGTAEKEVFSAPQKTLMSKLNIDPCNVLKSPEAIAVVMEFETDIRKLTTLFTVLLTSKTLIDANIIKLKSLNHQRRNGIINPKEYSREIRKITLSSVLTIFSLIMTYRRCDYTNTWTVLLETCLLMILPQFVSTFIINILSK